MKIMNWQHKMTIAMLGLGLSFMSLQSMGCSGFSLDGGGDGCVTGGCSGTSCRETEDDSVSTCEWREEYACYKQHGTCERGADDQCGWRASQALQDCIAAAQNSGGGTSGDCVVGGCSGQLCLEPGNEIVTTCEWREEYACYQQHGTCERGVDNQCGWRATQELQDCIDAANNPSTRTPVSDQCIRNATDACTSDADCKAGGCGGELCEGINNNGASDCNCTAPQGISCGCVNGTCSWWQ